MLVIGLMSGTSLDGIDAALVEINGAATAPEWTVRAFVERPYSAQQRSSLHEALTGNASRLCRVHAELGEWFAAAALEVCAAAQVRPADVRVIGSHGQTIWHEPPTDACRGATLQLGCAATIAERTGIDVVSDFRSRDVAAGGHGAPLVPWFDRLFLTHATRRRVLQNIGGMANLTWLPARGSRDDLLAFDTGPGNALIDAAVELATQGAHSFDEGGAWAAEGAIDEVLLDDLLRMDYFRAAPPKSTGRELFGRPMVEEIARTRSPSSRAEWASLIATLTELTAHSVARAITSWVLPRGVDEVIITGGGALNPALMRSIERQLAPVSVRGSQAALGMNPSSKEAVAFGALAWAHVQGIPANEPGATGARGARLLGSLTPGGGVNENRGENRP